MTKLFNYLLILNVFLGGFVLFSSPFEFYVGYIFIISFLMMYMLHPNKICINLKFMIILIVFRCMRVCGYTQDIVFEVGGKGKEFKKLAFFCI